MPPEFGEATEVNCFSLVAYLPDSLAAFLDPFRRTLVPGCQARAHITVLPPRPLTCPVEQAAADLQRFLRDVPPFRVALGQVRMFPVSEAVYLEVTQGTAELRHLHDATNRGCLEQVEGFLYQPHVTLAQDLDPARAREALARAEQSWRDYQGPREFWVDRLFFVQNTVANRWMDLKEFVLPATVTA